MALILVHSPGTLSPERDYILDVVLREFLGLDFTVIPSSGNDVRISVCGSPGELTIPELFLATPPERWLTPASMPVEPVTRIPAPPELRTVNARVPEQILALFGEPSPTVFFRHENGGTLAVDIFGSCFFMLSRYEELVVGTRDNLDRFPGSAGLAVREGFVERPVVNEWVEALWAAMQLLWPGLRRANHQYEVCLSHDVDEVSLRGRTPFTVLRTISADVLLRREPVTALQKGWAWAWASATDSVSKWDPYNCFDFIMNVSEAHGLKSAFYFIPGKSHQYDARYTLHDPWIRSLMRRMSARGHEIGYHASYNTYLEPERTVAECALLRRVCEEEGITEPIRGGRQHYLRWSNPQTWQNWENCGLEYDSTLTFPENAGFRTGCCFQYPVWNLVNRQRLGLRERSLVVMENSLLGYQRLSQADAASKILGLAGTVRSFGGQFTLLWHNSSLASRVARRNYSGIVAAVR